MANVARSPATQHMMALAQRLRLLGFRRAASVQPLLVKPRTKTETELNT